MNARALGLCVCLFAGVIAAQDSAFKVTGKPGGEGQKQQTIAANRQAISCLDALDQLAQAVNWNLAVETKPLEADLRLVTVDLNLSAQDPRVVAQLIAVAGGADVVFDAGDPANALRPTLHVVRSPDPSTEAGRQRLRAQSSQWYRSFLADELAREPRVAAEAPQVRMNLGQLLAQAGDLEGAITYFTQVWDNQPDQNVPTAVLRIAQCRLDLAQAVRDKSQRLDEFKKAEDWARRLLENFPQSPQAAAGTIALGRALLGQERWDDCRVELSARAIRLLDAIEMCDLWLLVGEAQFQLQQPNHVYETMLTLRESPHFGDMRDEQFLDYHFLLGYGAGSAGKPAMAQKSLEWFLIRGPADRRRGLAYVLLAQALLDQGSYLQSRAAAVAARERHMPELDEQWRRLAIKLYARTGLQLGDKEAAFRDLEVLVQRQQEDPELVLFLVDELLADHQWARASSVAAGLARRDDAIGDAARIRTVRALYAESKAAKNFTDFPPQAVQWALKISDQKLRAECSEMIGAAYEALGKPEHAADAYRGILR